MALFRIYPEKDNHIWSEPNVAGLYGNAGKDPILEIGGYPDINLTGRSNRTLIQFRQSDITSSIKIVSVNEAKSILEYSLIKPITPLNLSESDIIKSQKSPISSVNIDKSSTH